MTTTFILIRHGETKWNAQRKLMGITNVPLNAEGKRQAKAVARHLASYPLDVIFTSPLTRTRQTARAIHLLYPKISLIIKNELRERSFGDVEGFGYQDANTAYPELIYNETWNYHHFRPKNGESLADVEKRADTFLSSVLPAYEGKKVAIVSHGAFLRVLICRLMKIPLPDFSRAHMDNTAITILQHTTGHGAVIHAANYTAHLPSLVKKIEMKTD